MKTGAIKYCRTNVLSYTPPEMYFSDGLAYLDKSDAYSLGLVVIKIFLGKNKIKEFENSVVEIVNLCLNKKGETGYFFVDYLFL